MLDRKNKLSFTFDSKEVSLQYPDAENATFLEYCFDEDEQEKLKKFLKTFDCIYDIDLDCGMTADAVRLRFKYDTPDETIREICNRVIEHMWQPNYILIEVIGREIHTPEFFYSYEEAYEEMENRFFEANTRENGEIDDWSAYCESVNHDDCDWKIFKIK